MIDGRELSLIYGNQKNEECYALRDINFTVGSSEMVGIMGPSGSGKSSLLYVLSGLKKPTTGTVYYHNTILNELSSNELAGIRRKDFGFIFQRHFLIDYLTVLDNVLTVVNSKEKAWHEKAVNLLETLGIAHLALEKPYQMSVGQRQKVAVARALLTRPKVIFADEPTASLDHGNARRVMDVLASVKSQTTILVATHDESILEQADRVIQMWDGRIIRTT